MTRTITTVDELKTDGEEASDTNGPVPKTKDDLLEHLSALYDRIDGAPELDPALRLELRSAVADAGLAVERLATPVKENNA